MALSAQQVAAFFTECRDVDSQKKDTKLTPGSDYDKILKSTEEFILGKQKTVPNLKNIGWEFYYWRLRDLPSIIPANEPWGEYEDRILEFVFHKNNKDQSWYMEDWFRNQVEAAGEFDIMTYLVPALKKAGMKDKEIILLGLDSYDDPYFIYETKKEGDEETDVRTTVPSSFGKYLLQFLPKEGRMIMDCIAEEANSRFELARFFYEQHRDTLNAYIKEFIVPKGYCYDGIDLETVSFLLENDAAFYERDIVAGLEDKLKKQEMTVVNACQLWKQLDKAFAGKYENRLSILFKEHINRLESGEIKSWRGYADESFWEGGKYNYMSIVGFSDLWQREPAWTQQRLPVFVKNAPFLVPEFLHFLDEKFGEKVLPFFVDASTKNPKDVGNDYFKTLFELIEKYDFSSIENSLWDLTKTKAKRVRFMLATTLGKLGDRAVAKSQELLGAKSAEMRQTAALILAKINTEQSLAILSAAFNSEKNDDARDVMLESLSGKLYADVTEKTITDLVAYAKQRGKLDNSQVSWLKINALPKLYWTNGEVLTSDEILFLFYRMSRAKGIRPDLEAKAMLQLIDRSKSGEFAKKLFKLYIDNGGDAKQKYFLVLAGLLGDDEVVNLLRSQTNTWVDNARGKMAEYAVGALAMIGSNKALRAVEFFSRKYKSKNGNVGSAALAALEEAAEELGMDMNELADSIIPDFGFEGMFKTFTVNDSEYRAFIDVNFKMAFLDEDGKKLKSAPKGTAKELLDEFKEIGKEIRDVVKSQSPRLEQYMVTGRRWDWEAWEKFFLSNPIMFVYATRLVWGAFDAHGQLLQTFWCSEDTTLMSLEDEELELPAETATIGMVHPLMVTEDERKAWNQKFFDFGIEPIFPQMKRNVIQIEEKDKTAVQSDTFSGKKIEQGALFLAKTLEKLGWRRAEVSDGGYVPAYEKVFPELGIRAEVETEGITVGYYEEDASLGSLFFQSSPWKSYDERLAFGSIPAIVYSEVMADLRQILPTEKEAEAN